MRTLRLILIAFAALLTGSCGDSKHFTVALTIDDIGQQSVTMTYFADGTVYSNEAHATDKGVVKFEGSASEPALVEFTLTGPGTPLLMLVVKNGENVKCHLTLADPSAVTVKGSKTSEQFQAFLQENHDLIASGKYGELNNRIKAYILDNPGSVASTALLVSQFEMEGHEAMADSLLNVIDPDARPVNMIENFNAILRYRTEDNMKSPIRTLQLTGVRDSLVTVNTNDHSYTLLAFTGQDNSGRDSITRSLRALRKEYAKSRLGVVEISLLADSAVWRRIVKPDSLQWTQTWMPGAAAANAIQRMRVTRTPYFIVADSTGRQLYRTPYPSNAAAFIRKKVKLVLK